MVLNWSDWDVFSSISTLSSFSDEGLIKVVFIVWLGSTIFAFFWVAGLLYFFAGGDDGAAAAAASSMLQFLILDQQNFRMEKKLF
jgi:hypothetical protein